MHLATCKEITPIIVLFPSIARTPPSANRTLPDLYGVCFFFEAMPSRPRCLHLYEERLGVLEGFRVADIPMIVSAQERLELCFPCDHRQRPSILAIQLQEIEAPNAEVLLAVVAGVECAEIGRAAFPACQDLGIDDGPLLGSESSASRMLGNRLVNSALPNPPRAVLNQKPVFRIPCTRHGQWFIFAQRLNNVEPRSSPMSVKQPRAEDVTTEKCQSRHLAICDRLGSGPRVAPSEPAESVRRVLPVPCRCRAPA